VQGSPETNDKEFRDAIAFFCDSITFAHIDAITTSAMVLVRLKTKSVI